MMVNGKWASRTINHVPLIKKNFYGCVIEQCYAYYLNNLSMVFNKIFFNGREDDLRRARFGKAENPGRDGWQCD